MMVPVWMTLTLIAFVSGGFAGWTVRLHATNDRYLASLAAKYQAQQAWFDAQTTAALAEVDRDINRLKTTLRKGGKIGNSRGN